MNGRWWRVFAALFGGICAGIGVNIAVWLGTGHGASWIVTIIVGLAYAGLKWQADQ